MHTVSVVTPALPTRNKMLGELMDSVAKQYYAPIEHIVVVDYERNGPAVTLNKAAKAASGDWLALIADDDLMYPNHLETLVDAIEDDSGIIYTWCEVEGKEWNPNQEFDADMLQRQNFIPSTSLVKREVAEELGYWNPNSAGGMEDWDFWKRAHASGVRFQTIKEVTWRYRFHDGNFTYHREAAF